MSRRVLLIGALTAVVLVAFGVFAYTRWRAGAGVATSGAGAALTASGAWYTIYFTDPKYPDRPADRHGGIDEHFVEFLDGAQRSLDVAIYDFDLDNAADALVRAKGRGVQVRMVMDSDTLNNNPVVTVLGCAAFIAWFVA
jgi:phosphatidylserine/phosphatidylglycerophosphate/cardiolipin synthase-like enzyme